MSSTERAIIVNIMRVNSTAHMQQLVLKQYWELKTETVQCAWVFIAAGPAQCVNFRHSI